MDGRAVRPANIACCGKRAGGRKFSPERSWRYAEGSPGRSWRAIGRGHPSAEPGLRSSSSGSPCPDISHPGLTLGCVAIAINRRRPASCWPAAIFARTEWLQPTARAISDQLPPQTVFNSHATRSPGVDCSPGEGLVRSWAGLFPFFFVGIPISSFSWLITTNNISKLIQMEHTAGPNNLEQLGRATPTSQALNY